jgi:DUF1680 family protein
MPGRPTWLRRPATARCSSRWRSCFCCPPNLVRTIAETSTFTYGRSPAAIWVHLYASSVLETEVAPGSRFGLTQQTDYPWDGRVRITVDAAPASACSLRFRIPGWATGASLNLNGNTLPERLEAGRYIDLARVWSAGDVVELTLPMDARLMQAHPLVEEVRNQVAIQRGPIVYCLESVDLPDGIGVLDVVIPRDIVLRPRFEAGLLGGVTVLEGRGEARAEPGWSKQLYRELSATARSRAIDLRLVPYYAWGNRGHSEMTVWIPLGGS